MMRRHYQRFINGSCDEDTTDVLFVESTASVSPPTGLNLQRDTCSAPSSPRISYGAKSEMEGQRWLPLEANPEVMNQFLRQLGLVPTWQFGDVYGLDAEVLSLVPRPVCAVLLLFPITEKYETFRQEEEAKIKAQGQELSSDVYFMKQTIGNACGTIGLIHAVANNQRYLEFEPNSPLKAFLLTSAKMSPEEKAAFLEKDESIRVTHESSAQEGQTEAPSLDEKVDLHFIAFVNVEGHLYELDGRKPFPIVHGKTTEDTFLEDSAEVCKKFMARDPQELRFTVVALSKA
uniref:Ubiquitin carboxyl-terminal hydrolase n=2 Tax=Cyprinus carpio TaxID=7962 RepID=A0A8C1DY61_CYPCA